MRQAYGVNCVIIEDNGKDIRYVPRCPKCGNVERLHASGRYNVTWKCVCGTHVCDKCHERYNITIGR